MSVDFRVYEVLDHGEIQLVDYMGSDEAIERAARVSYSGGDESRKKSDRRGLIRYLMRHRHTSPFEMAELVFRVKCPIYVQRQWIRHRTASVNEISGRYSELPNEYHEQSEWRAQSSSNKQGSEGSVEEYEPLRFATSAGSWEWLGTTESAAFDEYRNRLDAGVAREQARTCLPLSTYTEFVWKINLHNLLHFLSLRLDSHAQQEIREYAQHIAGIVEKAFPLTWEAFKDYRLDAITLSGPEVRAIQKYDLVIAATGSGPLEPLSDRECKEVNEKLKVLNGD